MISSYPRLNLAVPHRGGWPRWCSRRCADCGVRGPEGGGTHSTDTDGPHRQRGLSAAGASGRVRDLPAQGPRICGRPRSRQPLESADSSRRRHAREHAELQPESGRSARASSTRSRSAACRTCAGSSTSQCTRDLPRTTGSTSATPSRSMRSARRWCLREVATREQRLRTSRICMSAIRRFRGAPAYRSHRTARST